MENDDTSGSPPTHRGLEQLVTRAAEVTPATANDESRTVQVVWTTGEPVLRGFFERYYEELSLDPKHVRMGRLASGRTPVLDAHDRFSGLRSVLGVVESARLEKGRGVATLRFAKGDPAADAAWLKIRQGIIRNVSVGYSVHRMEKVEGGDEKIPTYRATDWEPIEISPVPIGADSQAHIRAQETTTMDPTTLPPGQTHEATRELERETTIRSLVSRHPRLGTDFALDLVARRVPVEEARGLILARLAEISEADPPGANGQHYSVTGSTGASDRRIDLMAEALASRFGGPAPSAEARQYLRLRVVDLAKHTLETRGISTHLLSNATIVARALHTTSDFPTLLTETGNRMLRQGYESYQGGVRRICKPSTAPDFRAKTRVMLGEAPQLDQVLEGGEFKRGSMAESKESYRLATFGKVFGISRQALINDDLAAFTDLSTRLGRAAAEFVNGKLVDLLASNPVLNDGVATFHATHGNLGTAAVISVTSLGEGLKLMRLQKGLDGKTPIDVTPKYLVVPAALEVVAKQNVKLFNPVTVATVNPFAGELEVVVDPRLDAKSAISWYLSADPGSFDTIEYSFLDGDNGPVIETRVGFDVDGLETKVRLDFGSGVLDHRGLLRNAGA